MPLVDRDVGRLADRAARVVHPLRRIGELHEVAEVLDRRIAPPVLHVPHERRPVDRRQHETLAADRHVALGVARVLHVLPRRGGAEPPRQPLRQMHPVAAHVGARVLPQLQRLGVVGEPHPDLLEHRLGVRLDQREPLLVEDLVVRDPPPDERRRLDPQRRALGPPRRAAAPGRAGPPSLPRRSRSWHALPQTGSSIPPGHPITYREVRTPPGEIPSSRPPSATSAGHVAGRRATRQPSRRVSVPSPLSSTNSTVIVRALPSGPTAKRHPRRLVRHLLVREVGEEIAVEVGERQPLRAVRPDHQRQPPPSSTTCASPT